MTSHGIIKMSSGCLVPFFPERKIMASEHNQTEEKKTYTVGEIAEMLGISDKVAYTLVKSGQFKYVRVGRAIRVSKSSFDSWLEPN